MRVAVYFTPPRNHPLTLAASKWLGRDAFSDEAISRSVGGLSLAEFDALTAEPRRYGFHATLKAPFRLAEGVALEDVETKMGEFCAHAAERPIVRLKLQTLGNFIALTARPQDRAIAALAGKIVQAFEPLRASLTSQELAHRFKSSLTQAQAANVLRWGYPYVLDEYRYHMSLTGPVPTPQTAKILGAAKDWFGPFINQPITVASLSLFVQTDPTANFAVHASHSLGGALTHKDNVPKPESEGALILVVGPSGAGKDTLLNYVRDRLRGSDNIIFARRIITRAIFPDNEDHESESEAGFRRRKAAGEFALSWDAHELSYGLPASVDVAIRNGRTVVANVSRAVLSEARQKYMRVVVVNVTAAREILADRLRRRGRESESSIGQRLLREKQYPVEGPDVVLLDNSGDIGEAGDQLLALVRKCSCNILRRSAEST